MSARARLLCLLPAIAALAQPIDRLPEWARGPAREAIELQAPGGADAWILLDRTEFAYTGDGEIRQRHLRLVRVLTERGANQAVYVLSGLGGRANKIKKIKGWNARPDGELVRLERSDIVAVDADSDHEFTTAYRTGAVLERVAKGSLLAFESEKVFRHVTGPADTQWILEGQPIRRWEFELGTAGGFFSNLKHVEMSLESRNLKPWLGVDEITKGHAVRLQDLPPLPRDESATPAARDVLPRIVIRFNDSKATDLAPVDSWDALARWYEGRFRERAKAVPLDGLQPGDAKSFLVQARAWLARQTTYRQVYLTPDRSWIPDDAQEVRRKLYGDCKDLACLMGGFARGAGLESAPVLARAGGGRIAEDDPVETGAFDHVILAVALPRSLGLAAEVDTPKGRFLLIDLTARFTPMGLLPQGLRNQRIMLCLPTGAVWVTVTEAMVQRPGVHFRLAGALDATGKLDGTLSVTETADFLGFRSATATGGGKELKERLASFLEFPLEAAWNVEAPIDPTDLEVPFRFTLKLSVPGAFRKVASEWTVAPIGLPAVPAAIQKNGQPRRFPVERKGFGYWNFESELKLPFESLQPVLVKRHDRSGFREVEWQSEVNGRTWVARFSQTRKDAHFGFERREEGVKEARRDRALIKGLLEDGLTLKQAH